MVIRYTEKRGFPRIKLRTPLQYRIRGTSEFNHTVSDDISLSGIGIINPKFISPQTSLSLEIKLLSRVLRPIGRVAWAMPFSHADNYRLGIEFLELDPQEKNYLKNFINSQNVS